MSDRSTTRDAPALPRARGPFSGAILELVGGGEVDDHRPSSPEDPLGDDDLHLALYLCYELHYRGLPGVDDDREWDPGILGFRQRLEALFETELRRVVEIENVEAADIAETLVAIAAPPEGDSLPSILAREATLEHYREFLIHRSAYQLKEADPHSWVIPRLEGPPKTMVMDIQYDEYGSGDPSWMHSELFRRTMVGAGLDGSYGAYVDRLPGVTLATVNLISLFGLHRRWRGALVGHLAAFEMSSTLPNRAFGDGFRRLGFDADATRFFDEHVEADSVHEVLASDVALEVATREPALAADVVFGAKALALLEDRFSATLLRSWRRGASALFEETLVSR